jgi:hypothetical protein
MSYLAFGGRNSHEKEGQAVHSDELMLTIVWNSNGFYLINVLSKEIKFNANHYVTDVLASLRKWLKTQIGGHWTRSKIDCPCR